MTIAEDDVRAGLGEDGLGHEAALRYADAVRVFQQHHDHPGTVTAAELAAALGPYADRWTRRMRFLAHRHGFTGDDISLVTQVALQEFFEKKILTGVFDPRRSEFYLLQRLVLDRALDHWRSRRTRREALHLEGLWRRPEAPGAGEPDPFAGAVPAPSAEEEALAPRTVEEANERLCRAVGLKPRDAAVITYRFVYGIQDWETILELVNSEFPPPIAVGRLRNICTNAKNSIGAYLDAQRYREDAS